ncbi:MAG: membrane protein insertase YidC [Bacteroidales bacterium]|nr:membrane protein insertase YidC [Bacteroidales bacterium]
MDKNQIIGIILIFALLIGYGIYTAPSKEEKAAMQQRQDSISRARAEQLRFDSIKRIQDSIENAKIKETQNIVDTSVVDSVKNINLEKDYGVFANSVNGKEEFITLENQLIKIKFTTKGAYPYFAQLKNFQTYDSLPLILFDNNENQFDLSFSGKNIRINTSGLYFENMNGDTLIDASSSKQSVSLRINAGQGKYIEYLYTLEPESYILKFDVRFYGLEAELASNSSYIDILWKAKSRRQEHGAKWENQNTTIYYKQLNDKVTYMTGMSDDDEEILDTKVKWIAYKDHFFSTILIAHDSFSEAKIKYKKDELQEKYIKDFESNIYLEFDKSNDQKYEFSYYMGPNDYDILRKISVRGEDNLDLKRMIPLGWSVFRWVNQIIVIPLFNFLGSIFGSNMGLIILIMTLIIKLALFPLTFKSFKSSAKMRVLKPQIDEINKKIPKEKTMERQQATMALYKKVGVNPMGGCLPMLLQMPILIAMFRFFPASIELRQKSFLWATDLSSYDSIWTFPDGFSIPMYGDHVSLFTILMAVAMLISQLLNKNQMSGGNTQMPGMKFMLYLMPVMMLLWFNNYSAGLSYYYFLSNVITIIQTLVIRRMIDEKALLSQLNAQKKKPKKKSKWQTRLGEMQKQQELQKKKRR